MRTSILVLLALAVTGCDDDTTIPDPELCTNGADDDGDGAVDCDDSDCEEACVEICDDGEDNNGDGLIDCDDPTCEGGCVEVCDDGRDNDGDGGIDCDDRDCSGVCDEDCADGADNDADGLVDCEDPDCSGTCPEQCSNGLDDDDDMLVDCLDPDCLAVCDADGDGDKAIGKGGADCDDADPEVYLGAVESCDGKDNDCDELVDDLDPSVTGDVVLYADGDGDGFGHPGVWALRCAPGNGWADDQTDCNDEDATVSPGSPERPGDRIDQDCNGLEDCYEDGDGDGFGDAVLVDATGADLRCGPVSGAVTVDGDCNDGNGAVFPGATLRPTDVQDGVDRDCDGFDECFLDDDGDGFGQPVPTPDDGDGACDDSGESTTPTDCDDLDAARNPGASEVPGDAVDSDCNGLEDCYFDQDDDGWGSSTVVVDAAAGPAFDCDALPQSSSNDRDCDDLDPLATQSFDWLTDGDGDGWGAGAPVAVGCTPPDPYVVPDMGLDDCDDADPAINPGANDPEGDPEDTNCDGHPGMDGDGDGFGLVAAGGTDCDDTDPLIHPGAAAICYDHIDQDCDGADEFCDTAGSLRFHGAAVVDNPGDRYDGFEAWQLIGGQDTTGNGIINTGTGQTMCEWTWVATEWRDTPGTVGPPPYGMAGCVDNPTFGGQQTSCEFAFTATLRQGVETAGNCDLFNAPWMTASNGFFGVGYHDYYLVLVGLTYGPVLMYNGGSGWGWASQDVSYNPGNGNFQYAWDLLTLPPTYFP